ncbi:TonB-dependent receptor [Pedobacter sp. L105]|uniref:TonB-dependent receptor n=1 Tax=Pedobacter sp. L105 TaxID=1641871 RepID=UPI00131C2AE7|nr:TonB-dependent receptor [Pedobacter sp. L105]
MTARYLPLKFSFSNVSLSIFIALLLFNLSGYAQDTKGTISGKVQNNDYEPVENATVYLKGRPGKTTTNQAGEFSLSAAAGNYELIISIVGYKKETVKVHLLQGVTTSITPLLLSGSNDMNEVKIGGKSQNKQIKELPFNVNIVDTKQLYNNSSDINQVLNRTSGVRVREDGGVGSNFTFSLNGFSGKQVKFFLDGIPMDNFGSSLTLNNFPVNMAERVEVYKGVTPIGLGADALGGAVNIVTRNNPNYMDVSYGYGSFNTHKATFNAAYTNAKTGFTIRANAFYNYSDNDYKVDVSPINLITGQTEPEQEVKRFHDGYKSGTAQVEVGVTGKKYADKLLIGLIASGNDKDVQTGVTMEQVFGARTTRSASVIPTLKYKKADLFVKGLDVSLYSAYNMSVNRFIDTTRLKYNWLQQTIPTSTAELLRTQLKNKDNEELTTANIAYRINEHHAISYNYTLSDFTRKSSDLEDPNNVTYTYPQNLTKQIMGLAWQTDYKRFTATLFSKLYLLDANSFEQKGLTVADGYKQTSTNTSNTGYGAAVAYYILTGLQAKASYEHTYRLPDPTELLGDGLYVRRNSDLKPENSNNLNLGALYTLPLNSDHKIGIEANFIYRNAQNFIRLDQAQAQPIDRQYVNVGKVRTTGVEGEIKYAWADKIFASVNATYQNIIDKQQFITNSNLTGDNVTQNFYYNYRLPNIPYLFGNADIGTLLHNTWGKGNTLGLNYSLNYVEKYYLTPSGFGVNNTDDIPTQVSHNVSANYALSQGKYNITLECRDFTNNKLYDNYLLQKPGRSVFIKLRYFISK